MHSGSPLKDWREMDDPELDLGHDLVPAYYNIIM